MTYPSRSPIVLRRFAANESGVSAVEFAMLLPLMITLYLGSVEITQAVSADRKMSLVASTVGDLVARTDTSCISESEILTTFKAGNAVLYPFDATKMKIVITQAIVDDKQQAKVVEGSSGNGGWSRAYNGATKHSGDVTAAIPPELRTTEGPVIWAEANYTYVPTIGKIIAKDGINLGETIFLKPRSGKKIPIC
ncbi:pilus assembly protein [Xanthobacteraceae bacterium Astr-EGSB]|uniref:TadE/TadG family type IV pilus assembly protein n=1 Tax=Astrobacterium formosum TaxID=3069710 RepID=UPI0027B4AF88|nr:pilus assembly protein [Xanthobacteraceae bacterium Astr-EGSB]